MRGVARALAILVILLAPWRVAAQSAQYKDILALYRSGRFEQAVIDLRKIKLSLLELDVKALIQANADPFRREPLEAAALMHWETALAEGRRAVPLPRAPEQPISPRSEPPRARLSHGELAWRLVAVLEERLPNIRFLTGWYLLNISAAQREPTPMGGSSLAMHAPRVIRDQPEMQLAIGAIHETGWMYLQDGLGDMLVSRPSLADAEDALRRAMAGAGTAEEARLRLARVATIRGHMEEALQLLSAPFTEPGFQYLALLFAGDAHERLNDRARAADSYASAVRLMPRAHSAHMALGHVKYVGGERGAAAEIVRDMQQGKATDATDPWHWYSRGTAWRAAGYLEALRAMVR